MNKNRYKLVFSKAKSCLVPVAEFINSVTENNKSEKKNGKKEQESYRLSFLSQSIQEIVRPVLALPILLSLPAMATANPIEVDPNHKDKVSVEITSNNVAIIDIAKPEHDGISDNRFNKFNVENGAVFKNNKQADTSTLVGYQEKSKHLTDQSAKAILAQVTGHEETKLKGGLEVLGDKADLLIVNPNGVSVNGVRTFNTDRLVISTSNVIDPKKGLHLSVDKGQVSIEENGLATDGLRYVDIVAKKINQKGAIKHNTKTTLNPANINLVAGSSDYDVEKRTAKSKNVHNEEVILTGAETGSMYGDKVQFIVTDKGAGVHHKGIILSEADIVIESQGGKVSIETIQAKNVIDIKKAKNVEVNNKLEGRYILVDAKQTDLKKNASLKAGENILIDSSVNLENASKVRAKRVNISGENTKVSENATIIGHTITLDSKIDNKGTISARNTRITSKNLKNTGDILAEDELYLSVHGVKKMNDSQNVIENNYTNSGTIQSKNNAELIFLDNTSFSANLHGNLPQAKNTLKIISDDFTVEKDKEIQVANNLTIISNNLLNNGLITAFNTLDISAGRKATNNGLIGAGKSVKLNAIDIHNGEKGIFHSEGTTYLDAAFDFINDGRILSRKKLTIGASHLVNNATVTGDVIGKRYFVGSSSTNPRNLLRYDVYKIGGWIEELEGLNIKIKSMGHIISEDGFEFIQRDNKNPNESGIDNYGIINIKGEFFNNGTTRIRNNAKGISKDLGYHYFQKDNNASFLLRFQPFGRFGFISNPLSGESVYPFSSLKGLLDHLLYNEEAIKSSSLYSGYSSEYLKILKNIQSPQLQKVLTQVFGQDWESRDLQDLRRKWASAKRNPLLVEFYPDTQAKILADSITGSIQNIQNGNNGITNKFDSTLSAGNTKIVLPKVTFKNISSQSQDSSSDIDLSVLADLLGETNLFIDRSLQLQKPKPPVFNPNDEDKKLLEETEQEKLERIRKAKEEAERLLEEERQRKAQKAKEEKERQERIAKERREKAEKELQERQRKEREALEDEQSRLKAEKKRLEELERKSRELAERQRQEKLALEEKLRKEQEEAERKLQQEQLAREKAEEQKRQEEELRLKEYRAKLEQERRKAEELANQRALLENANRPRVEVDPLYHTRVKYIKQEEYVGADYFFNKVAPEVKGQNKVTVIGDNYFQHQLITRTIEKKVDNHLSLKYDLNNRDLVKRLMDNAVNKSQELNLTVGQALTKEQQASLKEDIIWYVKSEVNGKEVFIPQVYLAPETLADAKKYQGLGQAVIKARDIELKSKEFNNAGSVIANKIDIEAEGKIINSGDILSREKTKLKGLEGVELISQTVTDDQGNTVTEKANVISEGHVHLEAGLDKNVDLKAANVKGKTGFIKSKDLNVQDTYEVKTTHKSKEIKSRFSGLNVGVETLDKVDVNSVGSDVKFEHLHLALKGDLNQQGSKIDTDKTTGIVQGNINTKAGKNYSHSERTESILSLELAGGASALGHSTQISANEYSDPSIKSGPSDNAGVNADLGLALSNKIEAEALLKHKNSEFNAKSGKLHVLGNADIGGVDINKSGNELSQDKQSDKAKPSKEVAAEVANISLEEARKQKQKDLQALSKEQIADLMAEKGEDFYAKERSKKDEGFTLSAGSISSTKEKDSYFKAEAGFKVKVGVEAEGHSAVADFATGIAKHVNDKKQGLKQDGTVALQHASEALGLVTGDLVGGSVKRKIEFEASASVLRDKQDVRTHIGGKTSLIARDGDITLNNVQSDENSELSLTAKENININAGEREQKENATAVSEKIFDGATSSCGVMSKGCTVGVTGGVEASVHISNSDKKEVQNSELLSKKVTINAGKDLNLNGANIRTKQLNIDVEGTTNIISKQDHIERSEHSINAGATGGASINTALEITPTGTISAGYGYEYEKGNKINKQSGIIADRIVGELNDVNLSAGHIVDHNKGKDVVIKGNVTHQNVEESYHKDGGHGGGTVGINERGTAQLSLRGGRAEQHHYDATQKSTLDGIKSEDTSINTDINKAKEVHRDDRIAKSKFEFEILDAVELGQKARDKVKSHSSKLNDNSQNSTRNRPLVQEDSVSSNKVAEANPNNQAKRVLPELPTENSTKQKVESDYEEISAFTPKAKSAEVESDYADISTFAPKAKANEVESDYAEIPNITPKNTDIATPQPKSKAELEDLYAKVDKSPEARAKAEQRSAEAEAKQPKKAVVEVDDTPPALPPRPQAEENPYATIDKSPKARAKAEQRSAEAEAKQPKKAVVEADDTPPALPPRPQAEENPYATIDKSPEARAKAEQRSAEAEAKQPKKAVVEVDDTPPALPPRPQAEENPYATIDKSPEARAKAEQRSAEAEAKQPKKAVVEADDTPPALPPRPQADVSKPVVEKADVAKPSEEAAAPVVTEKKAESESFLSKVKKFFKGSDSDKAKKSPKTETKAETKASDAEPNYDNLPDSANLKGLLSLEKQRNADFGEQVLKNPQFLAEAKEAAKKYIPESTIKQMGDSPEFNDILTEGARKVEQRINDAVTFKPTAEEFNAIQNLVKELPKGTVITDTKVATDSVTEALASTSKTIQKNPELKEQIRGAIEEFLVKSKDQDLTVEMIEKLNHGLRPDEGADRVLYKKETLTKENAVFSSPESSKIQLKATVDFINQARKNGVEPSVLAGLVYQRLIAYHPFAEGNGRMARVIVNKLLLDAGYPPFTKFNESFETQIIPQTNTTAKSASSSEVVKEFLKELSQKNLPAGSEALPKLQKTEENVPLVAPKVESDYEEISAFTPKAKSAEVESDYADISTFAPKAKANEVESDYAEIPNLAPKNTEIATPQPKSKAELEDLYAKVDKSPEARAKAEQRSAEAEAKQPKKAVVEVDDTPPALPPRPQAEENPYATIDKSPEARAKAEQRSAEAEAKQPKKAVVEADDTPPALPPRPQADVSKPVVEKADVAKPSEEAAAPVVTEKKAESESFLSKVKKFFKGSDSDKAKKSPKTETKAETKASDAEPNYDNLPDSANLKGLLSLEKQRNADFGEQVLKNPQFLAEAKEAAKKYIPESTIKQMGDSPEFNDILTEGARKVEQRINDAVTFKPTAEEFNAIQNLVKELPKGTVITDTKVATDSVTEALASTSKTIQKNPELKEQIRGAIEEFLVKSKDQDLTVEMIEKLNHGLRPDEGADRVLYKKETLTKENAVFSSPESSKIQLKATVDFINQARKNGVEPSVLAGLVYQRLIAYHPFAEGNGRMARVIVNKLLLDAGYPPFTKFNESFETQIIPQTNTTAKSASSSEVVKEFLKELSQKNLPAGSEALPKLQKTEENAPLVAPKVESQAEATTKKATPIDDKVQSSTLVEKPRSALQQVKDKFQPLRVGKKIKEVRNSVEQYGGEVSFKYAQSKGEVFNEIIKHSETEHGTCEATCAFWIAKKVNDDQSLFKEIYPNGKEGKLDKQAFEKIKKLQTEFINSGSSATQQFKFTESWLNEQGAKVKQKQVGEYSRKDEVSGTVTNTEVKSLINAILDTGDSHSGVKKISINLEGGSHTVAASVKGEQVIFFDPNFGEITFKKREHFENWFKEAFWSKSGYAGTNSGKRFFNVINYDAK